MAVCAGEDRAARILEDIAEEPEEDEESEERQQEGHEEAEEGRSGQVPEGLLIGE